MSIYFKEGEFDLDKILIVSGIDFSPMYPDSTKLIKPEDDDLFYSSLYKNYTKLKDARGEGKLRQMLITLLNSMYTHKRVIVLISKRKFRELISSHDFNWGPNGLQWDGRRWKGFIKFLTSNGFRVLNPDTKGSSIPFAYELTSSSLLKYFQDVDVEAQRKQCLDFIYQRASQSTASRYPSQVVRVRSTKYTSSSSYDGRETPIVSEKGEEKNASQLFKNSSSPEGVPKNQLQLAFVNNTEDLHSSARFYRHVEKYFKWDDFDIRWKVQTVDMVKTFGKLLDKSVKNSNNKTIQQKVDDVLALIPVHGPGIMPISAIRDIVSLVAEESPYFKQKYASRYMKTISDRYEDFIKQYNEHVRPT